MTPGATLPPVAPAPNAALTPAQAFRRIAEAITVEAPTFEEFFPEAWKVIEPSAPLVMSWHIGLIGEYLHAVDLGQIQNLDINIPPSHLKSTIVTIVYPTWSWIRSPWLRYMFSSYASVLSESHSLSRRTIIESHYYQRAFGDIVRLTSDQNEKTFYWNTARGFMLATSVGGAATGFHCDRFIEDDLINPKMADSKADREAALRYDSQTVPSRFKDPKTAVRIHVAQRLHANDVTKQHEDEGGWTKLLIPAEAPTRMVVNFPISKRKIVREKGALICPERIGKAEIAKLKKALGRKGAAAQLQQDPETDEGAIIKRSDWKFYNPAAIPALSLKISSWDIASKTKEQNDNTAGLRMAQFDKGFLLLPFYVEEKMAYPEMKRRLKTSYDELPVDAVLIEDKSSGIAVVQDLMSGDDGTTANLPIIPIEPAGDKVQRLNTVAPAVEAGLWYLPEGEPWVEKFMDTMAKFPNIPHDDVVDAFSQGAAYLMGKLSTGSGPRITTG